MSIENNQNIKDILLPLKSAWCGIVFAIVTMNFIYLNRFGFFCDFSFVSPYGYFYLFVVTCLFFTYLFNSKFIISLKASNTDKAPMTKKLESEERHYLRFYPKYFMSKIFLWCITDVCVVFSLVISIKTENYSYLLITSLLAIIFNLVILKPNYIKFYNLKNQYE
jgi:hypothetical protein